MDSARVIKYHTGSGIPVPIVCFAGSVLCHAWISRAVTGGILGRGSSAAKRSTRELAARHAGAGAAGEVVRQLFEDPAGSYQVSRRGTRQTRTAVETMVPVVYPVETMGCGPSSPLNRNLGYYKTVGYRYMEEPFTETTTVQGKTPGLLERAAGVAMAGLSSAVFGGLLPEMTRRQDAALGAVSGSVLGKSVSKATGTYGDLVSSGQKDAHHIIQDAAVRDILGYNRMDAPAIQLDGPSNVVGTEHYYATITQRRKGILYPLGCVVCETRRRVNP